MKAKCAYTGQGAPSSFPSAAVFISHTGQDECARNLTTHLNDEFKRRGVSVFYDAQSIPPGCFWKDEIRSAVRNCSVFVAILSPSYFERFWCMRELDWALNHQRLIIPVYYMICRDGLPTNKAAFENKLAKKCEAIGCNDLDQWWDNVTRRLPEIQGISQTSSEKDADSKILNNIVEYAQSIVDKQHESLVQQRKISSQRENDSPCMILLNVFQAAPLAYEDYTGKENPIKLLDLDTEESILRDALDGTCINLRFETATSNALGTFLSRGGNFLHFSCHGHPDYLLIEDDYGGGHQLPVGDNLKGWIQAGGNQLSFVFVSACHSRSAGEAFVDAGVPHVVCCEQNGQTLSNTAAMVFSRDFYKAIAHGNTLRQAYNLAIYAVMNSSEVENPKKEASKFALLPEVDGAHCTTAQNLAYSSTMRTKASNISVPSKHGKTSMIPVPPQVYIGRELEMYRVLRALFVKKSRLARITGPEGIGKASFAKMLGHYMEKRKMWGCSQILWFPSSLKTGNTMSILSQWSKLFAVIENSYQPLPSQLESNPEYRSASQSILEHYYDEKQLLIVDAKALSDSSLQKLSIFLDDIFERTKHFKVIVVHRPCTNGVHIQSVRKPSGFPCIESDFSLLPLSFNATALLFEKVCPFGSSRNWSRETLVHKKSDVTFQVIGEGIPARTLALAKNMSFLECEKLMDLRRSSLQVSDFDRSLTHVTEMLHGNDNSDRYLLSQSYRTLGDLIEEESDEDIRSSSPPPLRSQAEVFARFAPLLRKEGEICRKNVTSFIRKARKGECVVTTIDGVQETKYTVKNDASWVVCGRAAGEYYVLSDEEFRENYDETTAKAIASTSNAFSRRLYQQGFQEYHSRRRVWARKVDENDMNFFLHKNKASSAASGEAYFVAPWGESMRVEQGDFLVMQYPDSGKNEIYRVELAVFLFSYASREKLKEHNGSCLVALRKPVSIVLVLALAFLLASRWASKYLGVQILNP